MAARKWITIAMLWVLSLIIVATIAHGQAVMRLTTPFVVSACDRDIGFRTIGRAGDHVVGNFVVRVNGEWVVLAEPPAGAKPH